MSEILPYSEGTIFAIPLRDGGYARGIVARAAPEGAVLFGYFFGPRISTPNELGEVGIQPEKAVSRMIFGDLGLLNGEWKIIASLHEWERSAWKMPDFVRRDPKLNRAWRVRRSDDDPSKMEMEEPVEFDVDLPPNISSGYGSVELKLTRLLD